MEHLWETKADKHRWVMFTPIEVCGLLGSSQATSEIAHLSVTDLAYTWME